MALEYVHTCFENGSPVQWELDADGTLRLGFYYDHERASPNRAAGHWWVQLHGQPGTELNVVLENFDNIWNGKTSSPISNRTNCFLATDGQSWSAVPLQKTPDNRLTFALRMESETLDLCRLEPYRLSDLERFLAEIARHPLVEITPIGHTVEGRELEMVRVGKVEAPCHVLIRARSHPWEPGGNWVVQGLIRALLEDTADNQRYRDAFCLYVMPMATKDGVVRGHTRFNVLGMDLNRNWDRPADPRLAPENAALERWLDGMAAQGRRPHLGIDLHNDNSGKLHLSRPEHNAEAHLARMQRFEALLREHTWFTEGSTAPSFRNHGTFGEGLLERYGIDACILELNCDWIAGLQKIPFGPDWELLGRQMREVFWGYARDLS